MDRGHMQKDKAFMKWPRLSGGIPASRMIPFLIILFSCSCLLFVCTHSLNAGQGTIRISVSASPNITASAKFSETSGNKVLEAGETGRIIISVRNTGHGTAEGVQASITPNKNVSGMRYDRTVDFGTLKPGEGETRECIIRTTDSLDSESVKFTVKVRDAQRKDSASDSVLFKTVASPKPEKKVVLKLPKLVIADMGIADKSCNLKIEAGESVDVTVRVQNIGEGAAEKVQTRIIPGEHVSLSDKGKTTFDIGNLDPGSYRDVRFTFSSDKGLDSGDRIPIEVKVTERRAQFAVSEDLGFSVNCRVKSDRFMKSM